MRHILSAPVAFGREAPEDASPVLDWFAATVLDRLASGAAVHVDRAVAPLAGTHGDRHVEVERAYSLAERVVFAWAAAVLTHVGEEGRRQGLSSLERFHPFDPHAPVYAAAMFDEYVEGLVGDAAEACKAAAASAAAAAELRLRARRGDDERLAEAGRAAARTLTAAFAAGAVADVVTPVKADGRGDDRRGRWRGCARRSAPLARRGRCRPGDGPRVSGSRAKLPQRTRGPPRRAACKTRR